MEGGERERLPLHKVLPQMTISIYYGEVYNIQHLERIVK